MLTLKVSGMTCGHCVAAVTKAVNTVPLVESVKVDLQRGEVVVGGSPDAVAVRNAIVEEGYEVQAAA
ncbi:MAG: heavy-metal-associated domain-containing protein [Proteobacteria bacterium]|nr:heavy-metal-associated domain-containing protein [Pseudomonadota bacterium]